MSTTAKSETISVPQACKMLGISRNATYERIQRTGYLVDGVPAIRAGRKLLVSRRALDAVLSGEVTQNDAD